MMQTLLEERFRLTFHREMRNQQVYELTVVSEGPQLEPGSPEDSPTWDGSFPGFSFGGPLQREGVISGRIVPQADCSRQYQFVPLSMAALSRALTLFLGQPVVDETELKGTYKATLVLTTEAEAGLMMNIMRPNGLPLPTPGAGGARGGRGEGPGGSQAPAPPPELVAPGCADPISLVTEGNPGSPDRALIKAVQKLGLKLQSGRAPIDTIVVDGINKVPTEN
jgi:uncharacterized protein (TIGR03435 family)